MITGQLGDVMQESARAGLSYIRSRADVLNLPEDFPNNLDIHIHLPEGAIPKDGPSAGITMATAIISALTRRPVRNDLAMTGEITLRGRVLPIGGLKEKALAAHRVGIRHLIIPADNEKDLGELPPRIRSEMTFSAVESMDAVLEIALLDVLPDTRALRILERTMTQPNAAHRHTSSDHPNADEVTTSIMPSTISGETEQPPPGA